MTVFDRLPAESPRLSRTVAVVWTLLIYLTIPFARSIQGAVSKNNLHGVYAVIVTLFVVSGCSLALLYLWNHRGAWSRRQAGWLLLIGGAYLGCTYALRHNPEEAIHFVQYGLLSLLLFRALVHSMRDRLIYIAVCLLCTVLGTIDEVIQWVTPGRFFDYRDIGINALAGLLMQAALLLGIRPRILCERAGPRSFRLVCRLAMLQLAILSLCMANTPSRVARYAVRVPGLLFLQHNPSAMTEFGYRHAHLPQIDFKSRLTLGALRALDAQRAEEAAAVLDAYQERGRYSAFLKAYTPAEDPFLHELRVHLFRRDHYRQTAESHLADEPMHQWHHTVAYCENQIAESCFPHTLAASNYRLRPAQVAFHRKHADPDVSYRSPVSRGLITGFKAWQIQGCLWVLIGLLYFVSRRCGKKIPGV